MPAYAPTQEQKPAWDPDRCARAGRASGGGTHYALLIPLHHRRTPLPRLQPLLLASLCVVAVPTAPVAARPSALPKGVCVLGLFVCQVEFLSLLSDYAIGGGAGDTVSRPPGPARTGFCYPPVSTLLIASAAPAAQVGGSREATGPVLGVRRRRSFVDAARADSLARRAAPADAPSPSTQERCPS
jgi:hypothetical protein